MLEPSIPIILKNTNECHPNAERPPQHKLPKQFHDITPQQCISVPSSHGTRQPLAVSAEIQYSTAVVASDLTIHVTIRFCLFIQLVVCVCVCACVRCLSVSWWFCVCMRRKPPTHHLLSLVHGQPPPPQPHYRTVESYCTFFVGASLLGTFLAVEETLNPYPYRCKKNCKKRKK